MKYPPALVVEPEKIVEVSQVLRDEFGFNFLCELTAVDYWPEEATTFQRHLWLLLTCQQCAHGAQSATQW